MVPWLIAWWLSVASTLASQHAAPRDLGLEESVEVRGRLPAPERAPATSPSHVIDGATLREGGARSLPEALARDVAFEVADQVGNGRQLSLELRGFSPESGATALFVDGVRLNEPDTNEPPWWLVRMEDVERVEIDAGPRGSFLGGGSMAGAVHVTSRRPRGIRSVEVAASAGSFGLRETSIVGEAPVGAWRLVASGAGMRQDGFRDGAALRESSARIGVERPLRRGTLGFTWAHLDGRWRQPGALTKDELEQDPSLSASNELDFQDAVQDLLILRGERAGRGRTDWSAVGSFRQRTGTILTTGRSGYGFQTEDSVQSLGAVFEARTRLLARRQWSLALRWGAETNRDRLHPEGFATDDVTDGEISTLQPWSAVDIDWDRAGAFVHLALSLPHAWEVEAGLRHDLSRVGRAGRELSLITGLMEPVDDDASFGDTTARIAVARRVELRRAVMAWRASWDESFLAPSATQLFAYPGFLSNPDLQPQRGSGPTTGFSLASEHVDVDLDAYQTEVKGEIAFEAGDAQGRSRNVNAGTSRRRGLELRLAWRPRAGIALTAAHAAVDARFLSDFPEGTHVAAGARIPLVPAWRSSLAVDLGPWRGVSATLGLTRSGSMALSGDLDGSSPLLPGRSVVHVVVRADLPHARGMSLRLAADNLLDDATPVRGVERFDQPYYTPSPPHAVSLTLSYKHP